MLRDSTGTLNAAIFSPDCEKLIPFIALQLKETDDNISFIKYSM